MEGHLLMETLHHGLPESVIALRGGPVPVGFVEDDEMADTVETFLLHQPVQIIHTHFHPGRISLEGLVRRVKLAEQDFDIPVLAVGEEPEQRLRIPVPVEASPVIIEVLAADHAADEAGTEEIDTGEKLVPVGLGNPNAPAGRFVIGIPLDAASQIGRLEDLLRHADLQVPPSGAPADEHHQNNQPKASHKLSIISQVTSQCGHSLTVAK